MEPDRNAEIARLYLAGRSLADIAARFGLSQSRVSEIAKQQGCPRRPAGQPPKTDAGITKHCERCGRPHWRRVDASGRAEKPKEFARRRFCSKECKYRYIHDKNGERLNRLAWLVGKRTLLAKTCPACGELLPADRFQRQRRGYYATNCARCIQRGWVASLPEPDRKHLRQSRNAHTRRANDRSRDAARKHGQHWTGPELELLEQSDLPAPQLAAKLGRTISAVHRQRELLRRGDPVKVYLAGLTSEPVKVSPTRR